MDTTPKSHQCVTPEMMLLTKVQIHYLHLDYIYYIRMVCALLPGMYVAIRVSANEHEGTVVTAGSAEGGKVRAPSTDPAGRKTCRSDTRGTGRIPAVPGSVRKG